MPDGDWTIDYSAYDNYPGAALRFGRLDSGIYCLSEPDVTFADQEVADASMPGEDGNRMGRDYQRSMTVTFELGVDGVDGPIDLHHPQRPWTRGRRIGEWTEMERAIATVAKRDQGPYQWGSDGVDMLRQVWRAEGVRARAGRVARLAHRQAGRTRYVYGRPRKFAVSHSRLTKQGYTPVVCEFVSVDDRFYGSEKTAEMYDQQRVTLPPRPGRPAGPGWRIDSQKTTQVRQLGGTVTYPVIEIHGPCKNPKLTLAGLWAVQLSMTINAGEHVVISTRPWTRTVTHYKGSTTRSVADKLTRASPRLAEMFIPPGYWTASMSYTTAAVQLREGPRIRVIWRDAHTWW
ncbi:hypothetical protein [Streptomyces hirsutus]|uniref:hypothetical protein n=1 Tax=Streptomyces hirsutus TaxID=35620 RepID=UPI003323A1E2